MSSFRAPGLGPIVGHTTSHSCRLWIRGADPRDSGADIAEDRRTIGIISVLKDSGDPDPKRTYYFRLHREFDRTGTFNLGVTKSFGLEKDQPLDPDKRYRVRMATLSFDDSFENDEMVEDSTLLDRLPPPNNWAKEFKKAFKTMTAAEIRRCEASFQTFPDGKLDSLSFLIGSCRYPGFLFKRKRADRIFRPMLDYVQNNPDEKNPRFVLMVGDQIYADMFNRMIPIGLADTFEEFQSRYHDAFGSRHMRDLLRSVPHYMILDDHEIEDNWTQDRIEDRRSRMVFNLAIDAYRSYQWSHGPRNFGQRLFYSFDCGDFPFFVLDERTQRYKEDVEDELHDNHLLGHPTLHGPAEPSQLDLLIRWLSKQHDAQGNVPKFIVSPSVFVPNSIRTAQGSRQDEQSKKRSDRRKNASDSWPAFPNTRRRILDHIVANNIQNVVFLSGDIHCSCVATMHFKGSDQAKRLKAFAITSSALYWPFPFADGEPSGYVHDSTVPDQKDTFQLSNNITMDYTALNFTQEDNFCQIDVDRTSRSLVVRAIGQDGDPIMKLDEDGNPLKDQPLVSTLELAPETH